MSPKEVTYPYVVAICGASGVVYGVRLAALLLRHKVKVMVVVSHGGVQVLAHEMGYDPGTRFHAFMAGYGVGPETLQNLSVFSQDDIAAPPASGSFRHAGMVVAPCSMKTLAAVAAGYAGNLITRACDVTLKEGRRLILVPRETPLSLIHLENMARLARAGAVILPAMPSFYSFPATMDALVDTVVARIMDRLGVDHTLVPRWGE
ncbi:MAG: UbiX family flavin prenyltransferase [Desulfotignum sp.]|nr:UbiX family flavin prenyltransferase [Desulfotignum sp.]